MARWGLMAALAALLWSGGCESDDPAATDLPDGGGQAGGDGSAAGADGAGGSAGADGAAPNECEPRPGDYPGDAWPDCVSDDGAYHAFDPNSISSIARIAAFEDLADLLWRAGGAPTSEAFLDARDIYQLDEGLDSRVARRYDAHVPDPGDGSDCREASGLAHPDWCVGPAVIQPLLLAALNAGFAGQEPLANAARVEAGLVWFFYVSVYKESTSCAGKAGDCDSSYTYYTGFRQPGEGMLGFASRVADLEPETHARILDGLLAVRCWRDLDGGQEAADLEMQGRALGQLDPALDRGLVALLIDRLHTLAGADGDAKAAAWAYLKVLGPALDRAARALDPSVADRLAAAWESDGNLDTDVVAGDLDDLFPCP